MPLRETPLGKECPPGKFKLNFKEIPISFEIYQNKNCYGCDFSNNSKFIETFENCMCPRDMNMENYLKLKRIYSPNNKSHVRKDFWKFIEENYKKGKISGI